MAEAEQLIAENLGIWSSAIKAKSSAGRGNSKKFELYGIKKLRELILELAVRGLLVPQYSNDEPASELLKKISAEKAKLIKNKDIRKTKSPSLPAQPPMGELPGNWVWTNLYEIGEIGPRNDAENDAEASFVPMQLISEKYGTPVEHEVKRWKEIKSGFTHFREEDVVLAKITPCFQNGKSVVMRGLSNGFGAGTTELHVFRAIGCWVVPEFVLIYLKSAGFILDGIPKMTGTAGQKRITRDYFAGNHFPLPPLHEQRRIVAKVDELMAICDELEKQQETSIIAHKILVKTVLDALTTVGARDGFTCAWVRISDHFDTLFTTEWSIDELKSSILHLAVDGKICPFGTEVQNHVLKDLLNFGPKNGFSAKEVPRETKLKVLKLGATSYGHLDLDQTKFVDEDIPSDSHLFLKEGDILIQRGNSANFVGSNIRIGEDLPNFIYPDLMMKLRANELAESEFLSMALMSPVCREFMWSRMTGTSGTMPKISKKIVESVPIKLPRDRRLQMEVVNRVNALMDLCNKLKTSINITQITQSQLTDAIVEEALN